MSSTAQLTVQPAEDSPAPAGLPRRFAAIVYDSLLLFAVLFFASLVVIAPFDIRYGDPLYPLYLLYVHGVGFLFFGWFWTHGGQTLGMKTWSIRIRPMNDGAVTWRQALIRYLAALLSWLLLGAGFLLSLFHPQRAALHDLLSGTRLIRTS